MSAVGKRPIGVTVIAWLNVVFSGLAIAYAPWYLFSSSGQLVAAMTGVPAPTAAIMTAIGGVVGVVICVLMLRGANLGRLLYLFWNPAWVALYGFVYRSSPMIWATIVFSAIWYLATTFFLLSNSVSAYFRGHAPTVPDPAQTPTVPPETATAPDETVTTTFGETLMEFPVEKVSVLRNVGRVLRKAASGVLLLFSGFYLTGIMMVSVLLYAFARPGDRPLGVIGIVVFGVLLLILTGVILGGLALYGLRLWRKVLGIFLVSVGGMLVLVAPALLMVYLMPVDALAPYYGHLPMDYDTFTSMLKLMALGCGIWGPVCLGVGIPLIVAQHKRDRARVAGEALP